MEETAVSENNFSRPNGDRRLCAGWNMSLLSGIFSQELSEVRSGWCLEGCLDLPGTLSLSLRPSYHLSRSFELPIEQLTSEI